jgi:twinkle protein
MEQQSGTPTHKIDCPVCGSKNNQVFLKEDGTEDSFCFGECGTYFPSDKVKSMDKSKYVKEYGMIKLKPYKASEYDSLPIVALTDRGLRKEVVELYGVRVGFSESDGETITHHYYPDTKAGKITGYEVRAVEDKKFSAVGDRKGSVDLWGKALASKNGSNKLFITEGRCDAMALYQVIIDNTPAKYKSYLPSVVSLTRGATSGLKDIINNREFVEKYKEVILVLDNDDAGVKATKDILQSFNTFKVCKLPLKDANDMLLAKRSKELYQAAVWDSSVIRQGEVLDITDFIELALEQPKMGIPFPWPTVTKATFGIRPNTIHIVGAAPKIGKTDHQHQLVEHLVFTEKVKVGMFDLENAPSKTAKKLAGKHDKVDYTRPDIDYDKESLRSTLLSMNNKVRFYDRSASRDWEDIRIAMEEMHLLDGINIFIVDPLTALVSRFASSEANDKLNEIMTDMSDFVMKYPVSVFLYSHVNPKPKGSKSHEAGGKVYSHEFTGSRAMEKWAHYGHGINRDRTEDCPEERKNMSEFRMLFDRDFGQSYSCDVYFDEKTITYLEPRRY